MLPRGDLSPLVPVPFSNVALPYLVDTVRLLSDVLPCAGRMEEKIIQRWEAICGGSLPKVNWALQTKTGDPAGWFGWIGYPNHTDSSSGEWQTTTFLTSQFRGTGLLPRIRTWQTQDIETIKTWCKKTGNPAPTRLVTSIAEDNARSLRASRNYFRGMGYPDTWEYVAERYRNAYVFTWPNNFIK